MRSDSADISPESGNHTQPRLRLVVVTPVYNDWESFGTLLMHLEDAFASHPVDLSVLAVDDGSDQFPPTELCNCAPNTNVRVLHLSCNLGHQRALVVALSEAYKAERFDAVVVMDADGEDRPEDVPRLVEEHLANPSDIVVARRTRRSEGPLFRALYQVYKLCFRLLIGRPIFFGNFSIIPANRVKRLLLMPELWSHLAASYLRSRIPMRTVPLVRGRRYAGASKMNLPSLVVHGLSAISVFADVLVARILLTSVGLCALSALGVLVVVAIRIFTDLAIAGWATSAVGVLLILSMQALLVSLTSSFIILSARTQIPMSLLAESQRFVHDSIVVPKKESADDRVYRYGA